MITELLSCLLGQSSRFIKCSVEPTGNVINLHRLNFHVAQDVTISLRHLAGQLLSIGSHYALIDEFVHLDHHNLPDYRCSQTLLAFAEALQKNLNEYVMTVVELEAQSACLTIQKMQYILCRPQHAMESLAKTVLFVCKNGLKAAQILSYLTDQITALTGDEMLQQMHTVLAEQTAVPFMEMIDMWMRKGVILDPLGEFMLEEKVLPSREDDTCLLLNAYALRFDRLPNFLKNESEMILLTGKYLNMIRQCGYKVHCEMDEQLHYVPQQNTHLVSLLLIPLHTIFLQMVVVIICIWVQFVFYYSGWKDKSVFLW